jgi:hypothetical protein
MIAEKALPLRRSIQSAVHQELLAPSVFTLIFNRLSKLRTLCHLSPTRRLCFHKLTNTVYETTPRWSLGSGLDQASAVHRQLLSLPLFCKNDRNVFNHIQPLFSGFVGADPLFSTSSKLFSPKQGVGV